MSNPLYATREKAPYKMPQIFTSAVSEIDGVLAQYSDPAGELFRRYSHKSGEDQEAYVLALIGQVLTARRLQLFSCGSPSLIP